MQSAFWKGSVSAMVGCKCGKNWTSGYSSYGKKKIISNLCETAAEKKHLGVDHIQREKCQVHTFHSKYMLAHVLIC